MAPETLSELLDTAADDSRSALLCPDDRSTRSFGGLVEAAELIGRQLAAGGIRSGDRIAFVLPNGPEVVEVLLGIAGIGATAAPLNPAYTREEHAFYLDDLKPRALIVPAGEYQAAREAAPAETTLVELLPPTGGAPVLTIDGRELRAADDGDQATPDDIALLLHTSGTTSRPKQVPLRHRNLAASARAIGDFYELSASDVSYCCMPLFHVHGLVASVLAALSAGGSVVVPRRFTPRGFWPQARDYGITWFSAGPTLHRMVLDREDEDGVSETLRFTRSCSSALSPDLWKRAEERFGVPMLEAYGMTEASHQMTSNPLPPAVRQPGSVGVSAGAEVRTVDAEGRDVQTGQPGEVVIRGPGVTSGYLNNPEANEESFVDGWFRTGDQGILENGYLRLAGRLKELIIRGGENISPIEVEEVLLRHPAVAEAVCFGIPDDKYGEVVGAAVALSGEADERALGAHCRERLASFKAPSRIFVLDEIPRTPTGKVQRRRVGAQLIEPDE